MIRCKTTMLLDLTALGRQDEKDPYPHWCKSITPSMMNSSVRAGDARRIEKRGTVENEIVPVLKSFNAYPQYCSIV